MADDPYEDDIVGWSEDQAARLRRLAASEARPAGAGVDWPNVIEEVEAVGRFCLSTVRAKATTALLRVLMVHGWPDHPEAGRWLDAALGDLVEARAFSDPGMEGRLDLGEAYRHARREAEGLRMGGRPPRPLPAAIPLGFRDLGDPGCGPTELLCRVQAAAG